MNPVQIGLLKTTTGVLLGIGPKAFEAFYKELFRLAPETRALFHTDMEAQRFKLLNMIAILINALERPDDFVATAGHLGSRHAQQGVMRAYYAPAKVALMACLTEALGPDFTPDVREAWSALYDSVERGMRQGH